ncbi:unnamed protein product [Paramecium sonneborni]|uniref:Uncharacterized protein n=1 Tax=Paramecium sonneborni TaxID=65129 RepID=A0A8S1M6U3_9CILI|nr:unnamed protein product [Paramecium sonneborni]
MMVIVLEPSVSQFAQTILNSLLSYDNLNQFLQKIQGNKLNDYINYTN